MTPTVPTLSQNNPIKFCENGSKVKPLIGEIIRNERLSEKEWGQDVRSIEIFIQQSFNQTGKSANFESGDILCVLPENPKTVVEKMLEEFGLQGEKEISGIFFNTKFPFYSPSQNADFFTSISFPISLFHFFSKYLNICGTPRRFFYQQLAHFATNEKQKEKLEYFGRGEGQSELFAYNNKEKRQFHEVFSEFDSARPPLSHLISLIGPLEEKMFTISSPPPFLPPFPLPSPPPSPNHPPFPLPTYPLPVDTQLHSIPKDGDPSGKMNEGLKVERGEGLKVKREGLKVEITMAVIEFETPLKRKRRGVCSGWMSERKEGEEVRVWIKKGAVHIPLKKQKFPFIFVGPGTGCSLFKCFIGERSLLRKIEQVEVGETHFYFGCRHQNQDFLYKSFWDEMCKEKTIHFFNVAFSRDQEEKVYVQHLLLKNGKQICQLILNKQAHIIVSGNAKKMPKEVRDAFLQILLRFSDNLFAVEEQAEQYIRNMELNGRYQTETWN